MHILAKVAREYGGVTPLRAPASFLRKIRYGNKKTHHDRK